MLLKIWTIPIETFLIVYLIKARLYDIYKDNSRTENFGTMENKNVLFVSMRATLDQILRSDFEKIVSLWFFLW